MTYPDSLHGVNDEHIFEIFHSTVHPVVEWSSSLGKLEMLSFDRLQDLYHGLS